MKKFKLLLIYTLLPFITAVSKPNTVTIADTPDFNKRKFDYYYTEAIRLRNGGKIDCAIDLLSECFFINPQNAAIAYEFALIYNGIKEPSTALYFFQKAAALDSENVWYKIYLISAFVQNGKTNEAIEVCEEIFKRNESDEIIERVEFIALRLYEQTNQFEKCIQILDNIEKRNGSSPEISLQKYQYYSAIGKEKKAISEIDKIIKTNPRNADYLLIKGDILLKNNDKKNALDCYEKAAKIDSHNLGVIGSRIDYYNYNMDYATADSLTVKFLKDSTFSIDDKFMIINHLLEYKVSTTRTECWLNALLEIYGNNSKFLTFYASVLSESGKDKKAISVLKKILSLNPQDIGTWHILANSYLKIGQYDSVFATTTDAIKLFPTDMISYWYRAMSYSGSQIENARNDYNTAIKYLSSAKMDDSSPMSDSTRIKIHAELLMGIANTYHIEKNLTTAKDYYAQAYEKDPKNILLLNNYAYCLAELNTDLDLAERLAGKAVNAYPSTTYLDTYAWIFFKKKNLILARLYIEQAISKIKTQDENTAVAYEHYGDILYHCGNKEEALKYWKQAKDLGLKSKILDKKIETKTYIEAQ